MKHNKVFWQSRLFCQLLFGCWCWYLCQDITSKFSSLRFLSMSLSFCRLWPADIEPLQTTLSHCSKFDNICFFETWWHCNNWLRCCHIKKLKKKFALYQPFRENVLFRLDSFAVSFQQNLTLLKVIKVHSHSSVDFFSWYEGMTKNKRMVKIYSCMVVEWLFSYFVSWIQKNEFKDNL